MKMCGILPGEAVLGDLNMQFGYVQVTQLLRTPLGTEAEPTYRAHEYHHSSATGPQNGADGMQRCRRRHRGRGGMLYRNTLGSYAHVHFAGEPQLAANFLAACRDFHDTITPATDM